MNWENHLIKDLQWSNEIINREAKERVAREIAATAKAGDVIGAGSGSTVYLTLFELAKRIHEEHLHLEVIPASQEISMTCIQLGIPQTTLWDKRPDWTFDGADEVDPDRNLIKGRGGAMFKEKLLTEAAAKHSLSSIQQTCQYLGKQIPHTGRGVPECTVIRRKRTVPTGGLRNITTSRPRKRRSYFDRKRKLYPRYPFPLY